MHDKGCRSPVLDKRCLSQKKDTAGGDLTPHNLLGLLLKLFIPQTEGIELLDFQLAR